MWQAILCVSAGAVLGALGRWGLSQWLNPIFSAFNFGTLFVNFVGCFLIGLLMAFFWQFPQFNGLWKLFLNTGFLGAFTTFSFFFIGNDRIVHVRKMAKRVSRHFAPCDGRSI